MLCLLWSVCHTVKVFCGYQDDRVRYGLIKYINCRGVRMKYVLVNKFDEIVDTVDLAAMGKMPPLFSR